MLSTELLITSCGGAKLQGRLLLPVTPKVVVSVCTYLDQAKSAIISFCFVQFSFRRRLPTHSQHLGHPAHRTAATGCGCESRIARPAPYLCSAWYWQSRLLHDLESIIRQIPDSSVGLSEQLGLDYACAFFSNFKHGENTVTSYRILLWGNLLMSLNNKGTAF